MSIAKGRRFLIYYDPANPQTCISRNAKIHISPNSAVIIPIITMVFILLVAISITVWSENKNSFKGKTSDSSVGAKCNVKLIQGDYDQKRIDKNSIIFV